MDICLGDESIPQGGRHFCVELAARLDEGAVAPDVACLGSFPSKLATAKKGGSAGGVKGAAAPRSGLPLTPPSIPNIAGDSFEGKDPRHA